MTPALLSLLQYTAGIILLWVGSGYIIEGRLQHVAVIILIIGAAMCVAGLDRLRRLCFESHILKERMATIKAGLVTVNAEEWLSPLVLAAPRENSISAHVARCAAAELGRMAIDYATRSVHSDDLGQRIRWSLTILREAPHP